MDTCIVCGSTGNLFGSVDLLAAVCYTDLVAFEQWADENRDALYSDWPALIRA